MHQRTGNEDRAFQGIGHLITKLPADGGEQSVLGTDQMLPGVGNHEATGSVSVFGHPRRKTCLPEQCRLLVSCGTGNRRGASKQRFVYFGNDSTGRNDFRQGFRRNAESCKDLGVPFAFLDVKNEGPGSITDFDGVGFTSTQFPDQPTVDGTKTEFPLACKVRSFRNILENPVHLRT